MRDWTDPDAYAFTRRLDAARWAWEFLRRNPRYRREHAAFRATWDALEAAYGCPPHRDFNAWKADPRAYVSLGEEASGDCRVDRDKVLIECHLGARWGFYKFPVDPAEDDPIGQGLLAWRPLAQDPEILGVADAAWLGGDPARVALGFDLSLSLREQIEGARRLLIVLQRQRTRQGAVRVLTPAARAEDWTRFLRLLDAEAAGVEPARIGARLGGPGIAVDRREAHALVEGGYRRIAGGASRD